MNRCGSAIPSRTAFGPRRARGPFSQAVEEGGLAFDFDVSSLESFRALLYFKVHRLAFE